ncbi:hypothetical protein [Hydrogenophaga taeniospiralis]|nr:hypothetical protein [Hydrogenophaga taeniospiralis]
MATQTVVRPSKKVPQVRELRVALPSDMPFDKIVDVLKQTLTIPELPGIKGCRPCLSGLDRFVFEDIVNGRFR